MISSSPGSAPTVLSSTKAQAIDLLFSPQSLVRLCCLAEEHALNAGKPGFIKAYPSGVIPVNLPDYPAGIGIIALDFGGTTVKAVGLETTGKAFELNPIASTSISSRAASDSSMGHSISDSVFSVATGLNLSAAQKDNVKVISIAYSQAASLVGFKDGATSGMTAIVPEDFKGGIKNEAFLKSVKPGDDIGILCLVALKKAGFQNIETLRVDNDSIATACVPAPKDIIFSNPSYQTRTGGVVASTGANFTIFIDDKITGQPLKELANSEGGGEFKIPGSFLSPQLIDGFKKAGINEVSVERLAARINLVDQFFWEIDNTLNNSIAPFFTTISAQDRAAITGNKDCTKLIERIVKNDINGIYNLMREFNITFKENLSPSELVSVNTIATGIGLRSAQMCALLCYTSASNCLDNSNYIANLDASMVGIFPDFAKNTQRFVDEMLVARERNGQIRINHMPPDGSLSIPIRGGIDIALKENVKRNS